MGGDIMKGLNKKLHKYINDPIDPYVNAELAYEYEKIGQGAPAVSFFLRAAELSYEKDPELAYCGVLKVFDQIEKTGGRDNFCKSQLIVAMNFLPNRPEAYLLMSLWNSWRRNWVEALYWIERGLDKMQGCSCNHKPLPYNVGPGSAEENVNKDAYLVQKAYLLWCVGGRNEESQKAWITLYNKKNLFEGARKVTVANLKNYLKDKVDIVLQGQYSDYAFETARKYLDLKFVNKIIISCWENDEVPDILDSRIRVIKNIEPENPGTGQRNLQIRSSLNGIKAADTEFVVKMRNDQRYTLDSMYKMYEFYNNNNTKEISYQADSERPYNKICVAGNFNELLFHPRDHIFWGNKEDLIDLFDIPLEDWSLQDKIKLNHPGEYSLYYDKYIRTETYIGTHYAARFNNRINHYLLKPESNLYDKSDNWKEVKRLSDNMTPKIFKSFPREGIELEWPKYGWKNYPYKMQKISFGESWHEEGF